MTMLRVGLVAVAILLAALAPKATAQERSTPANLVANGGFETTVNGAPQGWSVPDGFGALDVASAFGGARSLRVRNDDAASYRLVTQRLPCAPGGIYTFEARIKGENLSAPEGGQNRGASVFLEFFDARGEWLGGAYPQGTLGSFDWKTVSGFAPAPVAARTMSIGVYLRQGTTGTAWFDEVVVRSLTPALQLFLKVPHYRGLIRRGDASAWQADVLVERGVPANPRRLRAQILDRNRIVSTRILPVPARRGDATETALLSLSQSPGQSVHRRDARLRWHLQLLDAQGRALQSQIHEMRVLEAMPRVHIRRGGAWSVDGKPFFPLGIYLGPESDTSDKELARIASAGFNTVLCYSYGPGTKPRAFLDRAARHGLRVLYSLKDFYEFIWDFPRDGGKSGLQIAREHVLLLRDHPALLGWYLNDETDLDREPELRAMYRLVSSLDPQHPTVHVLYQYGLLDGYYNLTDVLGVDPYPVPRFPFSIVPQWTNAARVASRGAKSPLAVTQAFSYAVYSPPRPNNRAPTVDEMRCMNLLALTSGARGVLFYAYMDLWLKDDKRKERDEAKFAREWSSVRTVSRELATLLPALTNGRDEPLRATATHENLHFRAIRHGQTLQLIVANADEKRAATLTLPKAKAASAKLVFGNLKLRATPTKLIVEVPAHGSGVVNLR